MLGRRRPLMALGLVTRSVCEGDGKASKCEKVPRSRFGLVDDSIKPSAIRRRPLTLALSPDDRGEGTTCHDILNESNHNDRYFGGVLEVAFGAAVNRRALIDLTGSPFFVAASFAVNLIFFGGR